MSTCHFAVDTRRQDAGSDKRGGKLLQSQKNPYSRDPRTEAQIEAYRKKEDARSEWLRNYRDWEKYRMTLGDKVPKTYQTFERHKLADDEKYQEWQRLYREANSGTD